MCFSVALGVCVTLSVAHVSCFVREPMSLRSVSLLLGTKPFRDNENGQMPTFVGIFEEEMCGIGS